MSLETVLVGQVEDYTEWTDWEGSFFFPQQASDSAATVDWTFDVILWISVFFFVLIVLPMAVFVWKYRKRAGYKPKPAQDHNLALELGWSIIPTLILVYFFVEGVWGYLDMRTPPDEAAEYEIQVQASQFSWKFTYPNGTVSPKLVLPVNTPVKFRLQSEDVLHSFFIPAFRLKHDVVPGRYGTAWINPTRSGVYRLYCAEFCGDGHSLMRRDVDVVDKTWEEVMDDIKWKYEEHDLWANGQHLYVLNCSGCHSVDGSPKTGPSFKDSWNSQRETSGGSVLFDETYARESILDPNAKVLNGYPRPSPMPTFLGKFTEDEINYLIEFLKDPERR